MNKHLLRFNKDQKYIVFDYETCGLNLISRANKPWQLAFLVCERGAIKESYDFYIKWDPLPISEEAKRVTKFDIKKYQSSYVEPDKVLKVFEKYFYDPSYFLVGHNILGFDIYIHNLHRKLCGLDSDYSYINRIIDTNCLAKSIALDINYDNTDLFSWQSKLCSIRKKGLKTNLKSLCVKYKIDFNENMLHNALYDIEKNYEVFKKLMWDLNI